MTVLPVTVAIYPSDRMGRFYQARCAAGHTSGWCVSDAQARAFLHDVACAACREA